MRVLVFGASITQGYWDTEGGWVDRVRKYYDTLQIQDFSVSQPSVFNLGISADTSTDVLNRFDAEVHARSFKSKEVAVVLAIGTNNAVREADRFWSTPEKYRADLEALIAKASKFTKKIMFVGLPSCDETRTMPVAWGDFTYTNERLWLMEQTMREVCRAHDLPHVPIFETFQAEHAKQNLLRDGLHPNNAGHELIANLVRPELDGLLP